MTDTVLRVIRRDRRGSSSPVVVETSHGERFVKLCGASQGTPPLVAELIVGALADLIGLAVPARELIELPADVPSDDRNDELRDLLDASAGTNLAFSFIDGARDLAAPEFDKVDLVTAAHVLWLDALVFNVDRTPRNPNIMVRKGTVWCIDHGACLFWQHDWSSISEATASRVYPIATHLFHWAEPVLREVHAQAAPLLTRDALHAAAATVPDVWLGADPSRRREAHVAVLWKRLHALPQVAFPS